MKKYELVLDNKSYKLYKTTSLDFLSKLNLKKSDFLSINYADGIYSVYMPSSFKIEGVETTTNTWCRFKINMALNFELYGILYEVLKSFTDLKVSVLVISGYDTDYIFIDQAKLSLFLENADNKLSIISEPQEKLDCEDEHDPCSPLGSISFGMQ